MPSIRDRDDRTGSRRLSPFVSNRLLPFVSNRLLPFVSNRFAIDRRALAAFRIGLATVLLVDLLFRSRYLTEMYTNQGVLSTAALAEVYPVLATASLHGHVEALTGAAGVAALFALAGVVALALLVGYRTRLATVASLGLLVSLQARNPFVLNSGDLLLWQLLLFGAFLPLGSRWSIDSLRIGNTPHDRSVVASLATAALLVHVTLVYATNAAFKLRGETWVSGDGAASAFSMDQFTVFLGPWLADAPVVLTLVNYGWLGVLVASPLLVVMTDRWRTALALAIAGGHAMMALTMALAIFPLVSIVSLIVFVHSNGWDRIEAIVSTPVTDRVADRFGNMGSFGDVGRFGDLGSFGDVSSSHGDREPIQIRPDTVESRIGRTAKTIVTLLVVCLLVGSLVWNAAALGYVELTDDGAGIDPADHGWEMFAPDPSGVDRWFVVDAELESGEHVDGLDRSVVTTEPPPAVDETYPSARWRKYLISIAVVDNEAVSTSTASYVCDSVETHRGEPVNSVTITYVEQETWPDRGDDPGTHRLVTHRCGSSA